MKRRVPRLASDEEAKTFLGVLPTRIVPSETYRLFEQAMVEKKQIVCVYGGEPREVCPIILGHKQGEEAALTYQFAGGSTSRPLPPDGDWRCLGLSKVSEIQLREGPWISGNSHKQPSSCVDDVDLDVNPDSPYSPKRSLVQLRAARSARPAGTKGVGRSGMNPTREWAMGELRRMVFEALGEQQAEVWLFGSCGRSEVMQHSDIDIAILPRGDLPPGFFSELAERIEESEIPYDVDLVDLRSAAPTLLEEVRREGIRWRG